MISGKIHQENANLVCFKKNKIANNVENKWARAKSKKRGLKTVELFKYHLRVWPTHVKNWLIGKDSDTERDWGQEEKGTTEDEMAGWHHRLDGRVWVNSRSWWWTGRPGVLQFVWSQRVRHDWATELNWESILKSRNITLPTKFHLVKAMVFQ